MPGMQASAFAKLNLTLEILGRRDDGYHEIRTVMQAIDLADRLEICPSSHLQVECDDPSINGEGNLVWQAALALAQSGGCQPGVRIRIEKRIPVAMGLGGGSSDAAAALLALDRFWGLDLPWAELVRLAAGLGSDVPFFLYGGAALASGRGEVVEPLPSLPGTPVTLVCPAATLENKTGRLYGQLTPAHYSDGGVTRRLVMNLMAGSMAEEHLHNVFEGVAIETFPGLADLYQLIYEVTGRRPHLSGAGPALFCYPSSKEERNRLAGALQPYGAEAYFVQTLGRAARAGQLVSP